LAEKILFCILEEKSMKAKVIGVLGIIVFALTACNRQRSSAPEDDGIVVGWLQKNTTNVFETIINSGGLAYLDSAKASGTIKDYITLDGNTDPSTQISQANDLINLGVDVAILQPAESDGSAPAVQALVDAGIPVVVDNARTSNTAALASAYVGSYDVDAGEIMGKYILDTLGPSGAYAHLQGVIGNSAAIERTQGIHNIMDKASGWKMLDEQSAEWAGDKASRFTQDWIALYGTELKAILCDNDDMSVASKLACIEAGRPDIVVIGVDAIDSALAMVKAGELDATVFQDGKGQGSGAAEAAIKVAKGEPVQKEQFIPFVLITKENIGQYY
jgi:ABC-type sugar transport system substrate-binding protein